MLTLSIATLREHHACDLDKRISDLRRALPDVTEADEIPIRTWWDLPTTSVPDRIWSLRCCGHIGQQIAVRVAAAAARRVLHLAREQDRAVCLAAIEAAEAWAAEPTEARQEVATRAAVAARAAVYVADAAAAYACDAAASAAYAAYADDYDYSATCFDDYDYSVDHVADAAAYAAIATDYADDERAAQRADLDRLLAEVSPC